MELSAIYSYYSLGILRFMAGRIIPKTKSIFEGKRSGKDARQPRNFVSIFHASIVLYTMGQYVARSINCHIRLATEPVPRTVCGKCSQACGRASYTEHSFPTKNTHPDSVFFKTRPSSSLGAV
jgi:hypothetical protein